MKNMFNNAMTVLIALTGISFIYLGVIGISPVISDTYTIPPLLQIPLGILVIFMAFNHYKLNDKPKVK